jgi:hypothetical protein
VHLPWTLRRFNAHTAPVQTPERLPRDDPRPAPPPLPRPGDGLWALGERLTWLSGLLLAVSSFTGWYSGSGDGLTLSVMGWHTGALGKLVFFIGLAVLGLVALRAAGIDLPATLPESLVIVALGSLASVFVVIRVISVPEELLPADGRGIGIWISLMAALGVVVAGLLRASEEL